MEPWIYVLAFLICPTLGILLGRYIGMKVSVHRARQYMEFKTNTLREQYQEIIDFYE